MPIEELGPHRPFLQLPQARGHPHRRELVGRSEADLLDIRNFGAKSIDEVKMKLVGLGLALKDSPLGSTRRWPLWTTTARASTRTTSATTAGLRRNRAAVARWLPVSGECCCSATRHSRRIEGVQDACPDQGSRLGGSPSHQRLILANLATSLFHLRQDHTTEAKAKRLRPYAERLITKAKRGDLHNRREIQKVIRDKDVVHRLLTEIGPLFAAREGGYTGSPRRCRARATTPHGGHRS